MLNRKACRQLVTSITWLSAIQLQNCGRLSNVIVVSKNNTSTCIGMLYYFPMKLSPLKR